MPRAPRHPHTASGPPARDRVRVRVTRASLSDSTGRPLRSGGCLPVRGRLRKRVLVEGWEGGRSDRVFYAAFEGDGTYEGGGAGEQSCTPTSGVSSAQSDNSGARTRTPASRAVEFVNVVPDKVARHALVDAHDDFEVAFVGMVVPPFDDRTGRNSNELLVYSVRSRQDDERNGGRREIEDDGADVKLEGARRAATSAPVAADAEPAAAVTAMLQDASQTGLSARDVATIHFDPDVDGNQGGTVPNVFVTMPASKSVLVQGGCCESVSREWGEENERMKKYGSIGIRFTVLEIDRVTNAQAAAIANAADLSSVASSAGAVVPYANIISWAFSLASSVGSTQLKRYARPDYVLSTDFVFRLVRKHDDGSVTDVHGRAIRYAAAYLRVSE